MRDLVEGWWGSGLGPDAMAQLRDLFQRKLADTRESIHLHRKLEQELSDGLMYLETCRVCATPAAVTGCANCAQDHGLPTEPVLVAGITSAPGASRRTPPNGLLQIEGRET